MSNIELIYDRLRESSEIKLRLIDSAEAISVAAESCAQAIRAGNKILIFGNGGSAADAQHFAAEFVGRFERNRRPLPAIALTTDTSVLTAIGNDYGFDDVFSRQVEALAQTGDVVIAISTSGQSKNVQSAIVTARKLRLTTVGFCGGDGGWLANYVDIALVVPSKVTSRIQEGHITIAHILCELVEDAVTERSSLANGREFTSKVIDWPTLLELREKWTREERIVVWTNGCFDFLHVGHIRSLQKARMLGDVLVVGVNGDNSARTLKGPGRPIVPARDRAEIVAGLQAVDRAVIFEEETPVEALRRLRPEIHCKGEEYREQGLPEADVIRDYGGRIEFLPMVPNVSTTELLARASGRRPIASK